MITIRNAKSTDTGGILKLLRQVLEIHAEIRPDIFVTGTTKYTEAELLEIIDSDKRPIYVACDESGELLGYAMCEIKDHSRENNIVPHRELYIDDLCVDSAARGRHIGQRLFLHVKEQAAQNGCYNITLNVWEGNGGARAFYDKMGIKPLKTTMELVLEQSF